MTNYTFILRACPDASKPAIAQLLGKAFSLKDSTCASIADSAPIVLLPDLTHEEAAAMYVVLAGFTRAGAVIEFASDVSDDLPKIDWPRRPSVFKREIPEYVADFQLLIPLDGGRKEPLINLLQQAFPGGSHTGSNIAVTISAGTGKVDRPAKETSGRASVAKPSTEFRGLNMPEITPFGGVSALPPPLPQLSKLPAAAPQVARAAPAAATPQGSTTKDDTVLRLNELFPEEESSHFVSNSQDITSILNKMLPDEEASGSTIMPISSPSPAGHPVGSGHRPSLGSGGHSVLSVPGHAVFLAKITDEGRRQKAVPLIAEMAKISLEEADTLSKKVIIPVLKGATQAEAEAAKQKFAKIGILARVKGAE